jgi:hypothetical protein
MTAPTRQQAPLPQLSARNRGGVTVVSLRGELDFLAVPALQGYLSDTRVRGRPRCVADLTGLAIVRPAERPFSCAGTNPYLPPIARADPTAGTRNPERGKHREHSEEDQAQGPDGQGTD